MTLAEQVHEAKAAFDHLEDELTKAVLAACGNFGDGEIRTDRYDNSIEVWGVREIDLDAAASKLKESGFERVWLHQHLDRVSCRCPCR